MYEIFLKNGASIPANTVTFEPQIITVMESFDAFNTAWAELTPENLEIFEVYKDGHRFTGFTNVELGSAQIVPNPDGTLTVHFYLAGQPTESVDPAYKTAYEMMTGDYDA